MGVWMCVNSLAKGEEEERSGLQKKVFRQLFFFSDQPRGAGDTYLL